MGVTVYAYAVDPSAGTLTGFGNSIESVFEELRKVRAEIELEDGNKVGTSEIYAFYLYRPDLDQLLLVLSGDAELGDLILKNKRVVAKLPKDSA